MQPIIRHTLYLIMYIDKNKFCRILKATDYIAYKSKFLKSWKSTSGPGNTAKSQQLYVYY